MVLVRSAEFRALLIQDEAARRKQKNRFALRVRRAAARAIKALEQFDFERLPDVNRALVEGCERAERARP